MVFSKSIEKHVLHLEEVMALISQYSLKIKLSKCSIAQERTELLGHVVDSDGIHVVDDKVVSIK